MCQVWIVHPPFTPILTCELRRRPPLEELQSGPLPISTPVRAALQPLKLGIVIAAPCSSTPNEPASTQSKSSDDTDGGGVAGGGGELGGGWYWRLIFTLDSPSSPLDCRVYLPTQLASAEDRQTDNERWGGGSAARGMEGGAAAALALIVYEDGRCLSMAS